MPGRKKLDEKKKPQLAGREAAGVCCLPPRGKVGRRGGLWRRRGERELIGSLQGVRD